MASGQIFQSLRRLTCFAAIADAGSIKGGAKRLGLSVPVVSTALSELEEELAVRLAIRSTRKLQLTVAGQEVYEQSKQMLASADNALNVATSERIKNGELRITLPIELASHWLPNYLLQFNQTYPGIKLTVDADDKVVPLHSSEYDIAIQANYQPPNAKADTVINKSSIALGTINLVCVTATKPRIRWQGSNAYMNNSLLEIRDREGSLLAVEKKSGKTVHVYGNGRIASNNHETALALAREGLGVVMVMEASAKKDLDAKRLTRVLPSYHFGHLNLEVKYRDSLPSPPAKAFVEFIATQTGDNTQ